MEVICEEIGRNYHTINSSPYQIEQISDIEYSIYANQNGTWTVEIFPANNLESKNTQVFPSEEEANFWIKKNADIIFRKSLNEDILRSFIQSIIIMSQQY